MKIAICEDEAIHQDILERLLRENGDESLEVHRYDSGESFLKDYRSGASFDVIFLDIHMYGLDGIDTANSIRELDEDVIIVLVTSLIEYAIKGYSVKAYEFVLKPIDPDRFKSVFLKIANELDSKKKRSYFIENRKESIALSMDDIFFIESFGRKVCVHTNNEHFEHYRSISDEEAMLARYGFSRSHKSYLVNLKNVYKIMPGEVILKNGESIPLSAKRYKQFYDEFTLFMIGGFK